MIKFNLKMFKMKKNVIEYWESELIPTMQFDSEEDAQNFDKVLLNYSKSKEAKKEFEQAEVGFPSWAAIQAAIDRGDFHFRLEGDHSDELIEACERMATRFYDECDPLDCYTPVMNYLFGTFHPREREALCKAGY